MKILIAFGLPSTPNPYHHPRHPLGKGLSSTPLLPPPARTHCRALLLPRPHPQRLESEVWRKGGGGCLPVGTRRHPRCRSPTQLAYPFGQKLSSTYLFGLTSCCRPLFWLYPRNLLKWPLSPKKYKNWLKMYQQDPSRPKNEVLQKNENRHT